MKIIYDHDFGTAFRRLPRDIQRMYRKQETLFRKNWRDPDCASKS